MADSTSKSWKTATQETGKVMLSGGASFADAVKTHWLQSLLVAGVVGIIILMVIAAVVFGAENPQANATSNQAGLPARSAAPTQAAPIRMLTPTAVANNCLGGVIDVYYIPNSTPNDAFRVSLYQDINLVAGLTDKITFTAFQESCVTVTDGGTTWILGFNMSDGTEYSYTLPKNDADAIGLYNSPDGRELLAINAGPF